MPELLGTNECKPGWGGGSTLPCHSIGQKAKCKSWQGFATIEGDEKGGHRFYQRNGPIRRHNKQPNGSIMISVSIGTISKLTTWYQLE